VIAAEDVIAAELENSLSIKGCSTVHGVVFRLFVFVATGREEIKKWFFSSSRPTLAHTQHASIGLWDAARP
jgi:hypothetical protein